MFYIEKRKQDNSIIQRPKYCFQNVNQRNLTRHILTIFEYVIQLKKHLNILIILFVFIQCYMSIYTMQMPMTLIESRLHSNEHKPNIKQEKNNS